MVGVFVGKVVVGVFVGKVVVGVFVGGDTLHIQKLFRVFFVSLAKSNASFLKVFELAEYEIQKYL